MVTSGRRVTRKVTSRSRKTGCPDFNRRMKDDEQKFKLWGVMSCKKCAKKWKEALQEKHNRVRVTEAPAGWEVWISI
jgi:hypothetical protein